MSLLYRTQAFECKFWSLDDMKTLSQVFCWGKAEKNGKVGRRKSTRGDELRWRGP